jgi:hypothetical protein
MEENIDIDINMDRGTHIMQIQIHDDDTYLVTELDQEDGVPFAVRVMTREQARVTLTRHINKVIIETAPTKLLPEINAEVAVGWSLIQADEILSNLADVNGPGQVAVIGLYGDGE